MTAVAFIVAFACMLFGLVYGYRCGRKDERRSWRYFNDARSEFIDGQRIKEK